MFYTYILHCSDGKLYTGYTNDLTIRFNKHKNGYIKATKNRRLLNLIHYEAFIQEADAKQRELYLKGGNGKKEIEILLKSYFEKYPWIK